MYQLPQNNDKEKPYTMKIPEDASSGILYYVGNIVCDISGITTMLASKRKSARLALIMPCLKENVRL